MRPVLLKALDNCVRQPSQVAIVTEGVHAAACLLRMAGADEAGTAGRAEKMAELTKLLNADSGAEKQVRHQTNSVGFFIIWESKLQQGFFINKEKQVNILNANYNCFHTFYCRWLHNYN